MINKILDKIAEPKVAMIIGMILAFIALVLLIIYHDRIVIEYNESIFGDIMFLMRGQ